MIFLLPDVLVSMMEAFLQIINMLQMPVKSGLNPGIFGALIGQQFQQLSLTQIAEIILILLRFLRRLHGAHSTRRSLKTP